LVYYVERKGVWNLTKSKGSVAVSVKIKKTCMVHFLLTIIIVCQGKRRRKKVKKKEREHREGHRKRMAQ
jgi:hypothetical protein